MSTRTNSLFERSQRLTLAMLPSPRTRPRLARSLLRVAAAAPLFFHGSQKLFGWFNGEGITGFAGYLEALGIPLPTLSAALAALSEVCGALALLFGLGVWALLPALFTMLVATLTALRNGFSVQHGGVEFPLTLLLVLLAIVLLSQADVAPSESTTDRESR